MPKPNAAKFNLGQLCSHVNQQLNRGEVNTACASLRSWVAQAPPSVLHPERMPPKLRNVIVSLVSQGLGERRKPAAAANAATLATMANLTSAIGEWRLTLRALEEMPAVGAPPSGVAVAKTLRGANALAVLAWARRHDIAMDRVAALRALADMGRWDTALRVARSFDEDTGYAENYSAGVLVPYLANGGRWLKAAHVLQKAILQGAELQPAMALSILEQTARPSTWETCLTLAGMFARVRILDEMGPFGVHRLLVDACPDWAGSLQILQNALASGNRPSAKVVASVMARCEDSGKWEAAMAVTSVAYRSGFVTALGPECHRALVASFRASAAWDRAARAVSWMSAAGQAATAAGLPALLSMCAQSGSWDATASVAAAIIHTPSADLTLSSSERKKRGISKHAVSLFHEVPEAYDAFIRSCCSGGNWVGATHGLAMLLGDVRVSAVHPGLVEPVVKAAASAISWDATLRIVSSAELSEPRVSMDLGAYRAALAATLRPRDPALNHVVLALSEHVLQRGYKSDAYLSHVAVTAATELGEWERGLSFIQGGGTIAGRSSIDENRTVAALVGVAPPSARAAFQLALVAASRRFKPSPEGKRSPRHARSHRQGPPAETAATPENW